MRIAMVSENANPLTALDETAGGQHLLPVAALARALAARGHAVVIHTRADAPDRPRRVSLPDGVVVDHVPAGPAQPLPVEQRLPFVSDMGRELARRWVVERPDVLHAHCWTSGLAALAGTRTCGPDAPAVVQTFHTLGSVQRRHEGVADGDSAGRVRLEAAIARAASRLVAGSTDEVLELLALGARRQDVDVVPRGVDLDVFRPEGPTLAKGAPTRLVAAGRLTESQGYDAVIEALSTLPRAELVLAGGPPRDRLSAHPEARRLRALARRVGVGGRVHLLGHVPRSAMPALLRSADVVVCTPWYEPFGAVALEAMACGRPVVASAVGGLLDMVVEGATGVLVPPRDVVALSRALRGLLADPLRLDGYGLAAAERAHVRYPWSRVAEETERSYHRAAESSGVTSAAGSTMSAEPAAAR